MKQFLKKQLPSFALALLMMVSVIPAASAASKADIEVSVEAGDEVALSRSEFRSLYNEYSAVSGSTFSYLVFTDYDDLEDYGCFTAINKNGRTVTLDEDDLDDLWFYDSSSDIEYDSDCQLSGLTFVADDDAKEGTLTLKFTLQGTKKSDQVNGILAIEVDSDSGSDSISYTVKAGKTVDFDADDFYDFFEENYHSSTRSLRYVIFDKPSSSAFSDGTLYYNYGKSSEEAFTRSTLSSATFYYSDDSYGDYNLDKLTFAADSSFSKDIELPFRAYYDDNRYVDGAVEIIASGKSSSSSKDDIQMEVDPGDYVYFDEDDFNDYFQEEYKNYDFKYLVFTDSDNLGSSTGYVYYRYGRSSQVRFTASGLEDAYFYYDEDDIDEDEEDCYPLEDLSFAASKSFDGTVTLEFRAYYSSSKYVDGTVTITSSEGGSSSVKADISYEAKAGSKTVVDADDFNDYFQEKYKNYDFKYLVFTGSDNLNSYNGYFYYNYGRSSQVRFTASSLEDAYFYYDEDDIDEDEEDCYPLEDLSFVASNNFNTYVVLEFRAYYSNSKYVDGTVVFDSKSSGTSGTTVSYYLGNIRYSTTPGTNVQINANDIARFFSKSCPGYSMQYVLLTGVSSAGNLYYNYYGTSNYGTTSRIQVTSANAGGLAFYLSPTSTSQFALTELTYVPSGSNYCATISFTAYGTGGRSVSGAILISVTNTAVSEVYGVIPKNTAVNFPASSIYSAVLNATGSALSSIQLLSLPSRTTGTVYVGSGSNSPANTTTRYTYASGANSISQLRFVPNSGFIGSVEIPYVALNSNGTAIGVGIFSLGVVNTMKKFSDVTSSAWCYKYVSELSDAGIIGGYSDGSFKSNNTVTYGAALKLIMLAAGYSEQAPTGKNVFSGYLAKAKADGLVSGNIDLTKPITRLQVAQLAAKALKLDTSNLSSVKPFTDTSDPYVQALNAAGIVEGYFSKGTSTFKPNNTLTRGQISAIVWRMRQSK